MKHPWQVWLSFAACVLAAIGGMAWLTREAVNADRSRRAAEAESELEQRVSLALWRIDTELAPIIAAEVIRPVTEFRPGDTAVEPPSYVLLQFESLGKDHLWSPQMSHADKQNTSQWLEFKKAVDPLQLLAQLPNAILPTVANANGTVVIANAASEQSSTNEQNQQQFFEGNNWNALPHRNTAAQTAASLQLPKTKAVNLDPEVDFQQRSKRYQDAALQNLSNLNRGIVQNSNTWGPGMYNPTGRVWPTSQDQVGISRPVWIGDRLILARRANNGKQSYVQGSWLDWPRLKAHLLGEATDFLPKADLVAVNGNGAADPARMLAGLPVRLVVNEQVEATTISPTLRWALTMGWSAVLLAIAVAAFLLQGVMTLSERRAAFVSSVTHELRTPLTTFRMYAEMLAKGMVPDAARRQEYFQTLQSEAERLTMLVENVLAYARLERGRRPQAQDRVTVESLLGRVGARLKQRAAQAGMECVIELAGEQDINEAVDPSEASRGVLAPDGNAGVPDSLDLDRKRGRGRPGSLRSLEFTTDQAVVEQILFNLVDNAAKYAREAADKRIHVEANRNGELVMLTVRDHGPGMKNGFLSRPMQPFGKSAQESAESAPGVGLGLALCRRLAKQLGGRLDIDATSNDGATVALLLPVSADIA